MIEKLNRALIAACMGNMGQAAGHLAQAKSAIAQGQTLNEFVAHSHPSSRSKARAAYRLAEAEKQSTVLEVGAL